MLTHQACELMTDLGTSLVIVDEVHEIDRSRASHDQQSDQLKYFMDHVPATFVLAGINVENCGFFNGHRGEQLARRFTPLKVSPSSYSTIPQRQEWALLVEGFERALRLHAHKPGSLLPLADYLYGRTGGYIVSLSHLIREAAIMAILTGTERIDEALLEIRRTRPRSHRGSRRPAPGRPQDPKRSKTMTPVLPPPRKIPVVPRPRHGELSGSYLARVARANRTDLRSFLSLLGSLPSALSSESPDLAVMVLTLNEAAFSQAARLHRPGRRAAHQGDPVTSTQGDLPARRASRHPPLVREDTGGGLPWVPAAQRRRTLPTPACSRTRRRACATATGCSGRAAGSA